MSDVHSAQALPLFSLILFHYASSFYSGKMLVALHVVFLSAAVAQSRASSGADGKGDMDFCFAFALSVVVKPALVCTHGAHFVVLLRLREVQGSGVQRGAGQRFLGSDLLELDQRHQRL